MSDAAEGLVPDLVPERTHTAGLTPPAGDHLRRTTSTIDLGRVCLER